MMKPQLYSIVILLLARINYVQNTKSSTQDAATSSTQVSLSPISITPSVAKTPEESVISTTKAPDDHKASAPEHITTSVTKAPKGNPTSVAKISHETTDKVTVLSEAPNSKAASAPSLAPSGSPVHTTKGFTMTTRSDGTPRATGSTSISIGSQTSNPTLAGNGTTQRINKVTNPVRKTTRPTSTKPTTAKATGNRTSTFPVPSLFAIMLLVVSVLCF
ncbi:hypothetical protein E2320_018198 [Naja naja]|nr:hypothetical protein E2320_018198 [Naja naja]